MIQSELPVPNVISVVYYRQSGMGMVEHVLGNQEKL